MVLKGKIYFKLCAIETCLPDKKNHFETPILKHAFWHKTNSLYLGIKDEHKM